MGHIRRPPHRYAMASSIVGLTIFLLLTAMVQARWLANVDSAVMAAIYSLASETLYLLSTILSILFSVEGSLIYAIVIGLLVSRRLGRWWLAPFVFIILLPIELVMKMTVLQPPVPSEFLRSTPYPLTAFELAGSFPSGHAIHSGFLCTFSAILLWPVGGIPCRIASVALILLAGLTGFSRMYLGIHWLSDVIAGLALGASLALLVAPALASDMANQSAVVSSPG